MTELPGIIETERAIERAEGIAASLDARGKYDPPTHAEADETVDLLAILIAIARDHVKKKRTKEERRRGR